MRDETQEIDLLRERLFERFREIGVHVNIVPYPAHRTVEEGKALRGDMAGQFTKNLLLKDKKGRLFLVVADEDRIIDLKTLHARVGANGRLGFAQAERMRSVLAIGPGALTPMALINDRDRSVTVVIDKVLMSADQLNFHPLVNTESMGIHPKELMAFIDSCGHSALLVDLES